MATTYPGPVPSPLDFACNSWPNSWPPLIYQTCACDFPAAQKAFWIWLEGTSSYVQETHCGCPAIVLQIASSKLLVHISYFPP